MFKLENVTDAMIDSARAWARRGRTNAHKRALLADIWAGGDNARRAVISASRHHARVIFLPDSLVDAIEDYLARDGSKDPSSIGEQVAAMYQLRRAEILGIDSVTDAEGDG